MGRKVRHCDKVASCSRSFGLTIHAAEAEVYGSHPQACSNVVLRVSDSFCAIGSTSGDPNCPIVLYGTSSTKKQPGSLVSVVKHT